METQTWTGCYAGNWKGFITPGSFAHPAKFARGLASRILAFGLEQGFWKPGDLIGDPFAGIAAGGLLAAYAGLRWLGVELEPKFVEMAQANIERHRYRLEKLGMPLPCVSQGDSRQFAELVRHAAGIVTSPPYVGGGHHPDQTGSWGGLAAKKQCHGRDEAGYGQQPGQIGQLAEGSLDAVLTSPPYCGASPGGEGVLNDEKRQGVKYSSWQREEMRDRESGKYLPSPNIGMNHTPSTYWQAMQAVYGSCHAALKPGAVLVVVLKDYVRDGARVPLADQSARLLESLGFPVFLCVRALLSETTQEPGLFGEPVKNTRSRKSFFRRLHEKKRPDLAIDEECVLFCRQQSEQGG